MNPTERRNFVGGVGFVTRRRGGSVASDTLLSIAVTFTASGVVSGTTFTPTASSDRCQAVATGTYSISGPVDITTLVTWTSGTVGTATISNAGGSQGQITAVSANNGTSGADATSLITATLGAVSNNNTISVAVDRDSTSGIRCPVNTYQWSLLGYAPDGIYLCQEASGNLTDSGPAALTLTAAGSPLYQQSAAGWTRKGVGFNATANQRFSYASGVGSNPASVDIGWCFYMSMPTLPAGNRGFMTYGSATMNQITDGNLRLAGVNDSTTRPDVDDLIHPIYLLHDITNSRYLFYTDEAKTSIVFAALTDGIKSVGATPAGTSPDAASVAVYGFRFINADARLSDANVKSMLVALGWTVPWS